MVKIPYPEGDLVLFWKRSGDKLGANEPRRSLRLRGGHPSVHDKNAHCADRKPNAIAWQACMRSNSANEGGWEPEGRNRGFRPSVAPLWFLSLAMERKEHKNKHPHNPMARLMENRAQSDVYYIREKETFIYAVELGYRLAMKKMFPPDVDTSP